MIGELMIIPAISGTTIVGKGTAGRPVISRIAGIITGDKAASGHAFPKSNRADGMRPERLRGGLFPSMTGSFLRGRISRRESLLKRNGAPVPGQ